MSDTSNREKEIFEHALDLPLEERQRYIENACGDDAILLARIHALLRADESGEEFLPEQPKVSAGIITEKPGDTIGRYKLLQQIGEGGCGVVYMAEQSEPVRRRVALKIIKLGMDTKSVIARFEAERQALALMDHPNIAKVFDAGATDTGRPYFVMELVRGIKITEYCDQNNLGTEQRLNLFTQVCHAIQHAHQKGVIHRDIKPSNILVTVNDAAPVPKIIDFGIAKATNQQPLTDKTLFTAFEQFIGTPAYMSPEQAVMTSLDIDTRSDIYSLGVLLYELLTGKTPFDAAELLKAGLDEIRRTIREVEPVKPSTRLTQELEAGPMAAASAASADVSAVPADRSRSLRQRTLQVRGDLDWIVMKALEKDRTRRYETANGLARDVQRYLDNEPITARPPSRLYRLQKFVRRNKLAFAAANAVAAALVIGLSLSTWMFFKENAARERAVAAEKDQTRLLQQAQTEAAKSKQLAQFLKNAMFGASPYSRLPMDRDRTALREIADRAAERIGQELKGQPEVEAELRLTLAATYAGVGEPSKAAEMSREALRLRRAIFGETNRLVAVALGQLAFSASTYREAEACWRQALAIWEIVAGKESIDTANCMVSLGGRLEELPEKRAEAEQLNRDGLALLRKLHADDYCIAWALFHRAGILNTLGRHAEGEAAARESLAIFRKLYGENGYALLVLDQVAWALKAQGKLSDAEQVYREKWNFCRKALGDQNPTTIAALDNLTEMLMRENKNDEAGKTLRDLLQFQRAATNYSDMVWTLANLAAISRKQGNLAEANSFAYETVGLCTNYSIVLSPWKTWGVFSCLNETLVERGDRAAVETIAAWGVQNIRVNSRGYDKHLTIGLSDYAMVLARHGKPEQGRRLAEEAVKLCCEHPPEGVDSWLTHRVLEAIQAVLVPLGDVDALEVNALQLVQAQRNAAREPTSYADVLAETAGILLRQGHLPEARKLAEEARSIVGRKPEGLEPWLVTKTRDVLADVLRKLGKDAEASALLEEQNKVARDKEGDRR